MFGFPWLFWARLWLPWYLEGGGGGFSGGGEEHAGVNKGDGKVTVTLKH